MATNDNTFVVNDKRIKFEHNTEESSKFRLCALRLLYMTPFSHTGNIQAIVHFTADIMKHAERH